MLAIAHALISTPMGTPYLLLTISGFVMIFIWLRYLCEDIGSKKQSLKIETVSIVLVGAIVDCSSNV